MSLIETIKQISIDNVEYAKTYRSEDFFFHQNIAQCFEMADIHIYNEDVGTQKKFFLRVLEKPATSFFTLE